MWTERYLVRRNNSTKDNQCEPKENKCEKNENKCEPKECTKDNQWEEIILQTFTSPRKW
jgi:hypothetical protein